jgi:hypothetical protein
VVSWNVIHHGTLTEAAETVLEVHRVMRSGGLFQGTFLAQRNAKYGRGRKIAPNTFVIDEEDEKSHPHCYCDRDEMVDLLHGFEVLELELFEQKEPGSYHWHFIVERR